VLAVSKRLADINRQTIEAIQDIQDGNEDIARFNRGIIARNSELIENGATEAKNATPAANAAVIADNKRHIAAIHGRVVANKKRTEEVKAAALRNYHAIRAAAKAIYARRAEIKKNAENIAANQAKVSQFVSKL